MKTLLFLSVLLLSFTFSHGQVFKAGAAVRVITPDPLLPISGGVGTPSPVTEQKGDLFARPLVLEKGEILTPDLCGPMYDRIEQKAGGVALFMNSAQGGMVTADNRRENGKEANDWAECTRIGELMADEALRIIEFD